MWYWKSPREKSRIYFSTVHSALHNLQMSRKDLFSWDIPRVELICIPEREQLLIDGETAFKGTEPLKIPVEWRNGKAYPSIPLFARERRDRQESEALLGAQ